MDAHINFPSRPPRLASAQTSVAFTTYRPFQSISRARPHPPPPVGLRIRIGPSVERRFDYRPHPDWPSALSPRSRANGRQRITQRRVLRGTLKLGQERHEAVATVGFFPRLVFVSEIITTPAPSRIFRMARHTSSLA